MTNLELSLIEKSHESAKKQEAIGFAEWAQIGEWFQNLYNKKWYNGTDAELTTDQLYDLFKKENP